MDRRARVVDISGFGIRADQAVEVARLELVGVGRERLAVGHAVVRGASGEVVVEDQRTQGGVAARAAAADTEAPSINFALARQVAGGADAVLRVDDAPLAVEPLAVRAPEATAAAVVHVDDAKTPTGPELEL